MAKGISVNPSVIRWAIHASGKSVENISEKFSKIREWSTIESKLSVTDLNKLSKELRIPFGYFILETPPKEDIKLLKYRTINNLENENPSRELVDTIRSMEKRQNFMKEVLVEDGFSPLPFVGCKTLEDDFRKVSKDIIEKLNLEKGWNKKNKDTFNILREAVSNIGVILMQNGIAGNNTHRSLDVSEFRAFVLIDKYAPLIFLNSKDSENGKIFSVCHELVHIWLGLDELYNDRFKRDQEFENAELERFCNRVSAEMLLPLDLLVNIFDHNLTPYENLKNISDKFNVSDLVVCIKMKQEELISPKIFNELYPLLLEEINENMLKEEKKSKKSGGDYYRTQGSRMDINFVRSVDRRAKEGKILYTEAYELLGAKGNTYDKLVRHMEGGQ
ncbi:DNA-binding protein [Halolactibacillus miurensis]|uniref:DNA-binding protein n=1 Tax=Halolactibacillus miurensis TaxID=306541 RepID=A0A1I6U2K5_9BACI|nr:ImmA/IrrE family metallo-endopeptidase [Halolactibacillus miurensis]GEM05953.1 DNA-binding protein [Halolactibacillus miurensis]SFS95598.1 Zn-dependent peptidase ImmA, M78 family [Halolactibacillus miurensis]